MQVQRSLGVHSGHFHADDVTAAALLLFVDAIDRDKIYRTRDMQLLETMEYVCDVGGVYDPQKKRFDHHQPSYQGTLSSAGMIVRFLCETGKLSPTLTDFLQKHMIDGIDAGDNGLYQTPIGHLDFSSFVSLCVPLDPDISDEMMHRHFLQVVEKALEILHLLQKKHDNIEAAKEKVQKAMKQQKDCLEFDESLPWMESFFSLGGKDHPAQFILMPTKGGWKLRGIPPSYEQRMQVRKPFPSSWGGLSDQDLAKASGISGAIFCHKGGFISVWKTKEDAKRACRIVMQKR